MEPVCPPVWTYFCHLSGNENYAANTEQVQKNAISDKAVEGTIYRHAVYDVLWDITMVDTFEEYKEDLTLHCKRKYLAVVH